MKYQIQKVVADIGIKVIFASVEGGDNIGRTPEWKTERKERLEKLRKPCPTGARNYISEIYEQVWMDFEKMCSAYRNPETFYIEEAKV